MNETKENHLNHKEFWLIKRLIIEIKFDEVMDIESDDEHDYFIDYENECEELDIREGMTVLSDALAYPFKHEGFTEKEADMLRDCFRRFVPGFAEPIDYDDVKKHLIKKKIKEDVDMGL